MLQQIALYLGHSVRSCTFGNSNFGDFGGFLVLLESLLTN